MSVPAITRTFAIDDITPEELAAVFAAMDGAQQARFFSQVGKIVATWRGAGWCQQSCAISEHLDKVGTETILKLGEWAADPYVAPTPITPDPRDERCEHGVCWPWACHECDTKAWGEWPLPSAPGESA